MRVLKYKGKNCGGCDGVCTDILVMYVRTHSELLSTRPLGYHGIDFRVIALILCSCNPHRVTDYLRSCHHCFHLISRFLSHARDRAPINVHGYHVCEAASIADLCSIRESLCCPPIVFIAPVTRLRVKQSEKKSSGAEANWEIRA